MRRFIRGSIVGLAFWAFPAAFASDFSAVQMGLPLDDRTIYLVAGDLSSQTLPNLLLDGTQAFAPGARYLVQFSGPLTAEQLAEVAASGALLTDYYPQHAYLADLSAATPESLAQLGFLTWVGEWQYEWKVNPELGNREFFTEPRQLAAAAGEVLVDISLFPGVAADGTLALLAGLPGATAYRIESLGGTETITAQLPLVDVPVLAGGADVRWIEDAPEVQLRNNTVRWIVQSNVSNLTPLYTNGVTGLNQIGGVIDGRVRESHCSFDDAVNPGPTHRKIVAYNSSMGQDSHGTHVAGTMAGDAGANNDTRGVAYMAKFAFNIIPSFSDTGVYNALTTHHNQGARVHTNSWGNDGTTAYDGLARGIDRFSYDNEESLVCLAVTNTSTLKNPENAKNLLAVGASSDTPNQANHCTGGAGPTNDQRRKPEIYAPGCGILSSSSSTTCGTVSMSGTSMACPAIAGTGLLVRQFYTDGYYPSGAATPANAFVPSGALIKATLLNSAVDMTGVSGYPSNLEGWGRVLIDNALYFPGDARKQLVTDVRNVNGLTTGQQTEETIVVNSNSQQLRVTLVWTDPPASSGANPAYLNNLDLEVVSPTAALYRGNVFSGGSSTTGGTADFRNNVEQVHVNSPTPGDWIVRVKGTNVTAQGLAKQGYALVMTGDVSASDPTPPCPEDCSGDGQRDQGDLAQLLSCYNSGACCDINGDGITDQADLAALLAVYNTACP